MVSGAELKTGIANRVALAMQKTRDEIGATEQQRIAFGYAEAAMRKTLEVDEAYLSEMERAKQAIVAMRFHLETMPCRNNGGSLVRWKQEAERIIAKGFGE